VGARLKGTAGVGEGAKEMEKEGLNSEEGIESFLRSLGGSVATGGGAVESSARFPGGTYLLPEVWLFPPLK
jgi:hypothetical protein